MKYPMFKLTMLVVAGALSCSARADVIPNGLFCDNAVLQQGRRVPVWGTASEGEKVTVSFAGQKAEAVTKDGHWMVWLQPMKANATPKTLTISGSNTLAFKNILVGEVWLCGGQSNMQRLLPQSGEPSKDPAIPPKWQQDAAVANYPEIRHFAVPRTSSTVPLTTIAGQWEVCSPETVANFTAVGYYFGRDLYKELKVPIGLINNSYGGSQAKSWTRDGSLRANPEFAPILAEYAKEAETYPERLANYQAGEAKAKENYEKALAEAKATGKPRPNAPHPPADPLTNVNSPSALYNGMLNPLIPYAIRGVIWYQGESDRGNSARYRALFPSLIADWRNLWGEGDFPFLFVQVAPGNMIGPEIREAQFQTLKKSPNTAMTVITDWGDTTNIHPPHKEPVGQRLALAARALAYGQPIEYSGPLFKEAKSNGNSVTITFDNTGEGLNSRYGALIGFSIAGADKVFVPAQAKIVENNTVVVSSPKVANPVAVRYEGTKLENVNLYNSAGLPACTERYFLCTRAIPNQPLP